MGSFQWAAFGESLAGSRFPSLVPPSSWTIKVDRQSGGREDVDRAIYSKLSKTPRVFIETVNCECVLERRLQLLEAYLVLLSRTTSRDLMAYERVPQTW